MPTFKNANTGFYFLLVIGLLSGPAYSNDGINTAGMTAAGESNVQVASYPSTDVEVTIAGSANFVSAALNQSAEGDATTAAAPSQGELQANAAGSNNSLKKFIPKRVLLANTQGVSGVYSLTDGRPISKPTAKALIKLLTNAKERDAGKKYVLENIRKGVNPDSPLHKKLGVFVEATQGLLESSIPPADHLLAAVGTYNEAVGSANLAYLSDPPESFLAYQFILTVFTTSPTTEQATEEVAQTDTTEQTAATASEYAEEYYYEDGQ